MKIILYPETRQVYNYDCGANSLVSMLVYCGVEEREDRIAALAGTTKNGTCVAGVLRVLNYYGIPHRAGSNMSAKTLRAAVDLGHPTILTLQAYRDSNKSYKGLWDDGHWVVAIGYDETRIIMEDPASFHRTWIADDELHQRWHDVDRGGKRIFGWGCTALVNGVYQVDRIDHLD